MSELHLLVLCGGKGTRLESVWQLPKVLAPIGNTNYLEILLGVIKETKLEFKITLATGFKSQIIEQYIKKLEDELSISCETTELGTGGAVCNFLAHNKLERISVLNGDTLFSKNDLNCFFQKSLITDRTIIAANKVKLNDRYGSVEKKDHLVIETPTQMKVDDLVYAGLATLNTSHLSSEVSFPISMEQLLNRSYISEDDVEFMELRNGFYDIGTPKSLAEAKEWLEKS